MINMTIRTLIDEFLQRKSVQTAIAPATMADQCTLKAGVVPFVRSPKGSVEYLVMKPRPKHDETTFQICKGTRQYQDSPHHFTDIKMGEDPKGPKEPLAVTALREGAEELGLKPDDIKHMIDLGPYEFPSATTVGKMNRMHLFAVEIKAHDKAHILEKEVEKTTEARSWMTLEQFKEHGLASHYDILSNIDWGLSLLKAKEDHAAH